MATQAKCPKCKIHYVFALSERLPLRDRRCPRCGGPLQRTSWQSSLPIVQQDPRVR